MTFQVPWKLVLISAVVGILAAIALGGLAFAAAPHFDAVGVYFAPARLTIFVVEPLIPSRLMYWLVPDGASGSFFDPRVRNPILERVFWCDLLHVG